MISLGYGSSYHTSVPLMKASAAFILFPRPTPPYANASEETSEKTADHSSEAKDGMPLAPSKSPGQSSLPKQSEIGKSSAGGISPALLRYYFALAAISS